MDLGEAAGDSREELGFSLTSDDEEEELLRQAIALSLEGTEENDNEEEDEESEENEENEEEDEVNDKEEDEDDQEEDLLRRAIEMSLVD